MESRRGYRSDGIPAALMDGGSARCSAGDVGRPTSDEKAIAFSS